MRPQNAVRRMVYNLAAYMGLGSCPGQTPLDETAAVHVRQWVWQKSPLRSLPLPVTLPAARLAHACAGS